MSESTIKTLVLHANYTKKLSYYDDWMDAFVNHPAIEAVPLNICAIRDRSELRYAANQVDLIVLLHSTNGDTTHYLERVAPQLEDRSAPLVSFVGNEVNLPSSPIAEKRRVLALISPEFIATQLMIDAGRYLWADIATQEVVCMPHALNPSAFSLTKPWEERKIAVGVRAAKYSVTLGDNDRNRLHETVAGLGTIGGLPVEISESRLSRSEWANFLNNCRATVSSEAGTWFLERDDATVRAISEFAKAQNPRGFTVPSDGMVRRVGHKMPWWVRQAFRRLTSGGFLSLDTALIESLDRNEVQELFFQRPKPSHYSKCISSRHFDAIGAGTVQILLEGRYNELLLPNQHYLELKSDYSNLAELVELLDDEACCRQISRSALEHCMASHLYEHRVTKLIKELN